MNIEHIDTDVLIIGGGIAGLTAAIHARKYQEDVRLMLVDKGIPGASGASAFAAGILNYWQPGDDLENYFREIVVDNSEYLIDQDYVPEALRESYNTFQELLSYGVRFMRDEQGNITRIPSLGSQYGRCSPYAGGGLHLSWKIRSVALKAGTRFLERTVIVDLLHDAGGCLGAVGFGLDSNKVYVISAKAVIVAAGTLQFYQAPLGSMGAGDGLALALRGGAILRGMEQTAYVTIGPKGLGAPGLHIIFGCGGWLVNALGERFMDRYQPRLMEKARRFDLARAILEEWLAGRGPCYVDCTHLSEESLQVIRKSLPLLTRSLAAKGMDWSRDRIEYIPYGLAVSSVGGVGIKNITGETNVNGLWAIGYATDFCGGVMASAVSGLAGSGTQGRLAGKAVAEWVVGKKLRFLSESVIKRQVANVLAPWSAEVDGSYHRLEQLFTEVLGNLFREMNILKEATRLQKLLQDVREFRSCLHKLKVSDVHYLKKWHELNNILQLIEVSIHASMLREESRRAHFRRDFPLRDDHHWLKWILTKQDAQGNVSAWAEDIPLHRWPYRPDPGGKHTLETGA